MSAVQPLALVALDTNQRYSIAEAARYLRISRAKLYQEIKAGEIATIRDGDRRFVPGSEIVRLSSLPANSSSRSDARSSSSEKSAA